MRNLLLVLLLKSLVLLMVHVHARWKDTSHRGRVDNAGVCDMIEVRLMDAIGGLNRPGVHVDRE